MKREAERNKWPRGKKETGEYRGEKLTRPQKIGKKIRIGRVESGYQAGLIANPL
jgi:hypothetical protein